MKETFAFIRKIYEIFAIFTTFYVLRNVITYKILWEQKKSLKHRKNIAIRKNLLELRCISLLDICIYFFPGCISLPFCDPKDIASLRWDRRG